LNNFVYCLKKCKVCTVFTDSTHEWQVLIFCAL
jgi:hypothetical protein